MDNDEKSKINPPFEAYSGEKPFLFVCYNHSDESLVYPIIKHLQDNGVRIWYDEGIPVSRKWRETIANNLNRCSGFIVFITNSSIKSEYVLDEIDYALQRYKRKEIQFIPIYIEETIIPDELTLALGRIQAMMKHKMNDDIFYKKLLEQINAFNVNIPLKIRRELNFVDQKIRDEEELIEKERLKKKKDYLRRKKELIEKQAEFQKVKMELELKYLEEKKAKLINIERKKVEKKIKSEYPSEELDYKIKIIMLGDGTVGKTSLTKRYLTGIFKSKLKPTIGVEFYIKDLKIHENKIRMNIWDIAGQEGFKFLIPTYCLGSSGAILVYDITRPASFDNVKSWVSTFQKQNNIDTPIILVGNKTDLEKERMISKELARKICKKNSLAGYMECSAKTGINVEKIYETLTNFIMKKEQKSKF